MVNLGTQATDYNHRTYITHHRRLSSITHFRINILLSAYATPFVSIVVPFARGKYGFYKRTQVRQHKRQTIVRTYLSRLCLSTTFVYENTCSSFPYTISWLDRHSRHVWNVLLQRRTFFFEGTTIETRKKIVIVSVVVTVVIVVVSIATAVQVVIVVVVVVIVVVIVIVARVVTIMMIIVGKKQKKKKIYRTLVQNRFGNRSTGILPNVFQPFVCLILIVVYRATHHSTMEISCTQSILNNKVKSSSTRVYRSPSNFISSASLGFDVDESVTEQEEEHGREEERWTPDNHEKRATSISSWVTPVFETRSVGTTIKEARI